jgi:hypothetical protein
MRPVTSDEAFARGRSDCKRHKSAHAVPYKAREAAIHWEKGWWFEKDLMQREKKGRQISDSHPNQFSTAETK